MKVYDVNRALAHVDKDDDKDKYKDKEIVYVHCTGIGKVTLCCNKSIQKFPHCFSFAQFTLSSFSYDSLQKTLSVRLAPAIVSNIF